jgi:hypothetical protein
MVAIDGLPDRTLTDSEFEDFVAAQDVECPLAFHAYCLHCDTEGIVSALIRDGRTVYSLNHGRDAWELKTLEDDISPELFHLMVSQLEDDPGILQDITGGEQLRDIEPYPTENIDGAGGISDMDSELELPGDTAARDPSDSPPLRDLLDAQTRERVDKQLQELMNDRIDSLDVDDIEQLFEQEDGPTREELETYLTPDIVQELNDVIQDEIGDELATQLADELAARYDDLGIDFDDEFQMMLDIEDEQRFLDLYAQLLCYVNELFGVVSGVRTVEDIRKLDSETHMALREQLYAADTESLIDGFVGENSASLTEEDLEVASSWTDHRYGDFVVVRHLENVTVFLDTGDPPRAFGVTAVRRPFTDLFPEEELPVFVSQVALLPFEDQIVTDGLLALRQVVPGPNMSTDIDDTYEEAKHRFGIIERLPAPTQSDPTDAEQLQFYLKNKRNRERYAQEIDQLKTKDENLEQIYHQEMGKARARSLGRELRETDLKEAYLAIYDDRIIASGTSEDQVRDVLADILPDGKASHPYIYHYNP